MAKLVVLVAEDEPSDFLLLERAFQKAGILAHLQWVKNGVEAIEYLRGCEQTRDATPVLILSDIKMPLLDGFELLQFVKSDPLLRAIPFVILSSSAQDKDIDQCYARGANSYLVKPGAFNDLIEISRVLGTYWMDGNKMSGRAKS